MSNIKPRATSALPQTEISEPVVYKKEYKHNLIDNSVIPPHSIITAYGGYPITICYYSAVIGRSQEQDGFNPGQSTPHQSYRRINQLKIKLNSPFDYNMAPGTALTNISGNARVYAPGLIPMEGDAFLADIGAGRLGRFEVRSAPRALSWYDRTVYEFEFSLLELATIEVVNELDAKVVQKLNFVEEFILNGQNPIITDEDHANYLTLLQLAKDLTKLWLHESYSHEHLTLLVPKQDVTTYDPYIVTFALNLLEVDHHPALKRTRNLNVDDLQTRDYADVFKVILDRDLSSLALCFTHAHAVSTKQWIGNYSAASIRYSGIAHCIYPVQSNVGVDAHYNECSSGMAEGYPIVNDGPTAPQIDNTAIFVPMGTTGSYLFSEGFYKQTGGYEPHIEKLVNDYLHDEALDMNLLIRIALTRKHWSTLDKFYYTPVLIALIKSTIGAIGL